MAIIDKIRKLQALAERAGTEAEAASAAARVSELLIKHNLEIGSIALQQEQGTDAAVERELRRVRPHHVTLANACEELFDVRSYWTRRRFGGYRSTLSKFHFIGLSANVEAACITFAYLCDSIEALLAGWKLDRQKEEFWETPQALYRSFRMGAADRIEKISSQFKQRSTIHNPGSAELIQIGSSLAWNMLLKLDIKGGGYRSDRIPGDFYAYDEGYEQGARVDIHGARTSRMLK